MAGGPEQRKYSRIATDLPTRFKEAGFGADQTYLEARIKDVSKTGVFIATTDCFSEGTMIEFNILLPGEPKAFPAMGVVRRIINAEERGMGVDFVRIDRKDLRALDRYIDANQDFPAE